MIQQEYSQIPCKKTAEKLLKWKNFNNGNRIYITGSSMPMYEWFHISKTQD